MGRDSASQSNSLSQRGPIAVKAVRQRQCSIQPVEGATNSLSAKPNVCLGQTWFGLRATQHAYVHVLCKCQGILSGTSLKGSARACPTCLGDGSNDRGTCLNTVLGKIRPLASTPLSSVLHLKSVLRLPKGWRL